MNAPQELSCRRLWVDPPGCQSREIALHERATRRCDHDCASRCLSSAISTWSRKRSLAARSLNSMNRANCRLPCAAFHSRAGNPIHREPLFWCNIKSCRTSPLGKVAVKKPLRLCFGCGFQSLMRCQQRRVSRLAAYPSPPPCRPQRRFRRTPLGDSLCVQVGFNVSCPVADRDAAPHVGGTYPPAPPHDQRSGAYA